MVQTLKEKKTLSIAKYTSRYEGRYMSAYNFQVKESS